MTVVLEYRSGKTEIVSFVCYDPYPDRVRVRRNREERLFHWDRALRGGKPVYVEEGPAPPPLAAA